MWDFDEKAFDQFIIKKFNLKPETEKAPEENVENLNEAALSEAITESLNEDSIDEHAQMEEYRDIETYTYDYQMISNVNMSPNKQSIFSSKPRVKAKTDASKDSKFGTRMNNWSAGVPKESNVKVSEMNLQYTIQTN